MTERVEQVHRGRPLDAGAGFSEGGRALVADHATGLSGNADQGW